MHASDCAVCLLVYVRPDYISPLDDLAFDMYQDPEIAHILRKLERKKQEAVLGMNFRTY